MLTNCRSYIVKTEYTTHTVIYGRISPYTEQRSPRTMIAVVVTARNDNVYCRFVKFTVAHSRKWNVWQVLRPYLTVPYTVDNDRLTVW
jgi:hypothetical protein